MQDEAMRQHIASLPGVRRLQDARSNPLRGRTPKTTDVLFVLQDWTPSVKEEMLVNAEDDAPESERTRFFEAFIRGL